MLNITPINGIYYGSNIIDGTKNEIFRVTDIRKLLKDALYLTLRNSYSRLNLMSVPLTTYINKYVLTESNSRLYTILAIRYCKSSIDIPDIMGIKFGDVIYTERPIQITN